GVARSQRGRVQLRDGEAAEIRARTAGSLECSGGRITAANHHQISTGVEGKGEPSAGTGQDYQALWTELVNGVRAEVADAASSRGEADGNAEWRLRDICVAGCVHRDGVRHGPVERGNVARR